MGSAFLSLAAKPNSNFYSEWLIWEIAGCPVWLRYKGRAGRGQRSVGRGQIKELRVFSVGHGAREGLGEGSKQTSVLG